VAGSVEGLAIEVLGLQKVYVQGGLRRRNRSQHVALGGIDLRVEPGELFGLLGPNGAGKTTTVKILTTLLLPSAGSARVLGLDVVRSTRELRRRIGFVFGGERGLYWRLSGLDNLRYFADLYLVPPDVSRRRIPELLEMLGLKGREGDRVEHYSRGMKQRLHLARGLLNDPQVLFLDEPTLGIDPVGARELRTLIRRLVKEGKTVFLTTHYMLEADEVCDRIAVLKRGQVVAEGSPSSIKREVEGGGIVEFEVDGLSDELAARLRALSGVASLVLEERELTQLVSIHCSQPAEVLGSLSSTLQGLNFRRAAVRQPTLEDAYVRLVAE